MTRTRLPAVTILLAVLAVLLVPGTAAATTVADITGTLQRDHVYVDPRATADVDVETLQAEIGRSSRPVYVAVLPQQAADTTDGGATGLNNVIGRKLREAGVNSSILFTVTGTTLTGGSGNVGLAAGEAQQIALANQGDDTTDALVGAIRQATQAVADGVPSGSTSGGGFSTTSDQGGGAGGGAALGLLALLAVGGGGLLYARSRKRQQHQQQEMDGARADVESLYHRLGADVSNLAPGDDAVARQALADAAERYNATGALLSKSDTPAEFAAARRTAVEGLTAARLVRTRLGLDPGPDVPPPPGEGPQLQAAERVQVGDDEYEGSPTYAPGRQHYFGGGYLGGRMVPGGWYGVPFWETMLISSALSGGFGGFGGGYGGYERGYEEGVEDAREDQSDGGWGGGDDFGGGGFGGGWGGGDDFGGGGGGDFGGGGGDGGSW